MPLLAECPAMMPTQYVYRGVRSNEKISANTHPSLELASLLVFSNTVNFELTGIINEVNSYQHLQPGWDGEDSEPIPEEVISNTVSFVKSLGSFVNLIDEDYIYPTGDGTIVIDFQNKEKDLVSVEIRKTSIGYFFQTQGHVAEVNSESFVGIQYLPQKVAGAIRQVWERK